MRTPILALLLSVSSVASTLEFVTAAGSNNGGQDVSAKVRFDVKPGAIQVTLVNLFDNPRSISQSVSGLSFTLEYASVTGAALTSSSGKEIKFDKNGKYTIYEEVVPTGWMLRASGTTLELYVLGVKDVGPSHTLLGLGPYTDANSSITNYKGKHNPFLYGSATFTIAAPLVTAATRIRDVIFLFGSDGAQVSTVDDVTPDPSPPVADNPEPGSLLLMAGGLLGVLLLSSKYHRRRG